MVKTQNQSFNGEDESDAINIITLKRNEKNKNHKNTRSKLDTRNPPHYSASAFSFKDNEMTGLGLFASSSSSSSASASSSNLSPLALPFTVERSNPNKFNLGSIHDSHFNFNGKSDAAGFWANSPNFQSSTITQGLSADSIRTATVPSTYSTFHNPITASNTHNWSSTPAVNSSAISPNHRVIDAPFSAFHSPVITSSTTHNRSSVPAVSLPAIGPNHRAIDASFTSPFNTSSTHNWSSMNSSVKSGLEPGNPPASHVFGMNPNAQPPKWSFGNDVSPIEAPLVPVDFNLFPSTSFVQDYGSSQVGYSQSLSGSKYSGQADGSRGKDLSLFGAGAAFGGPATRENKIGPSVIGSSHGASPSTTCHGLVSSGVSNEHTFTWNACTSHYPFETRSIFYDSSSDEISPSVTTKNLDISSTSPLNKNNLSVSDNPLKEKESYQSVGFEYKSGLNSQVPEINSIKEVTSAASLSEHLDHHNPGEDSPCWKGAPTHFSSSGSQEQESSLHSMQKLQKIRDEDVMLPMDQSLLGTVENDASVVTSEILDVNMVVKALSNFSELLLLLYSKDECGLKEQDRKTLDHVIANLNVCMSKKNQQVDPARKPLSPQHITSNVPHKAVHLSTLHQESNNEQFGKNIEELPSADAGDEGLPKDYNMVQKIKKVLDEDLVCKEDLPANPLLYKNLWLEAEAELFVSSYRTRLHRAKGEMSKLKALDLSKVASDIKQMSSSKYTLTVPEPLHEAGGSKTSNVHAPNLSFPIVDNTDDVENSVMARFNILKRREESNPINMAEKETADVKASGTKIQSSGVSKEPHLQHLLDTDDAVMVHSHDSQKRQESHAKEDVDHAVMARLNILKSRGELDHVDAEQRVLTDGASALVSEEGVGRNMLANHFGPFTACSASSFGWEYVLEG